MTSKIPQEYSAIPDSGTENPTLNGTDIYLTIATVVVTCSIVHTGLNLFQLAQNLYLPPTFVLILMAINSLLAGHYAITHRYERYYRQRIWNSVRFALNLTFLAPFTIPAQIGQTLTTGVYINQNLFD